MIKWIIKRKEGQASIRKHMVQQVVLGAFLSLPTLRIKFEWIIVP